MEGTRAFLFVFRDENCGYINTWVSSCLLRRTIGLCGVLTEGEVFFLSHQTCKTDKLMCKNRLRTLDFEFETAFFGPRADVLGANRNLKLENKRVTDAAWAEGINISLYERDTCQSHPATLRNRPERLVWIGPERCLPLFHMSPDSPGTAAQLRSRANPLRWPPGRGSSGVLHLRVECESVSAQHPVGQVHLGQLLTEEKTSTD